MSLIDHKDWREIKNNLESNNREFAMTNSTNHTKNEIKPETLATPSLISQLRLPADFDQNYGAKRVLINVPIGKPTKEKFFRVHPDLDNTFDAVVLELKEQGEVYVLLPDLTDLVGNLARKVRLYLAVDRGGNPFLIPVTLPDLDGSHNRWHASLDQSLDIARDKWVRISANRSLGTYDVHVANSALEDPVWPEEDLASLVEIAFRGKIITSEKHPIIDTILGRI